MGNGGVFPVSLMNNLADLVVRARTGDLEAFSELIRRTQLMTYAVARSIVRDHGLAEDATQEAYLRGFRRLTDLESPDAFIPWIRRIVITVALNMRRARRSTWLQLEEIPDVPVLDETETRWSEQQRRHLASALVRLGEADRRLCDRRYHGQWTIARLAADAGVNDAAIRKRLQRVRDKLRKEIEVSEQREIHVHELNAALPAQIVELLARPRLTALPEHPVGATLQLLRSVYPDHVEIDLPEVVDLAAAEATIAGDAMYVDAAELHRLDAKRILRYDLTLPLLLNVRYEGKPLYVHAAGKAYRVGQIDATHLDAFHQAEIFCVDEHERLDAWRITGQVMQSVHALMPGRAVRISPTTYPMCAQAWELAVEDDGRWLEVLAWGVFNDRIVSHVGGDPARHTAIGVGYGLERVAMMRFGIDDVRKMERARVA